MDALGEKIYGALHRYWGFTSFRPVQEQIVRAAMEGRDTLALMPTGGGKSLTYQVPTMAREGLCIVVTPLIALMKDQVDRLRARNIPSVAIHSGLSPRQIDIALDNCVYGDVKFLYVAPERLATEAFRLRVVRMNVSLLAVDEAHCISQWGYDFRPSYLRIAELRERLPGVPVLALTASATKVVAEDIMRHLKFAEPHILRSSFARPNLSYSVRHTDDKNGQLLRLVRNVAGTGIVYMRTREGTEQIAELLREGDHRRSLPRRAGTRRTGAATGGVDLGQGPRDGRHERLRHGHRQARRALRGPLRPVRLTRELLPGGRARRTRRREGLCPAARGVGRQRADRPPFRTGVPAARPGQGDLRAGLLLPAHRHRRRGAAAPTCSTSTTSAPASGSGRGPCRAPSGSCSRTAT